MLAAVAAAAAPWKTLATPEPEQENFAQAQRQYTKMSVCECVFACKRCAKEHNAALGAGAAMGSATYVLAV